MDNKEYNRFSALVSRRIKSLNLIQAGNTDEVLQENLNDFVNETWLELANRGNLFERIEQIDSGTLSTSVSCVVHRLIGRKDQQRLSRTGMTGLPYKNKAAVVPLDIDLTGDENETHKMVRVTMMRLDQITEKVIHKVFFTDRADGGGFNPETFTLNKSAVKLLDPVELGYTTEPTQYEWRKLYAESLEKFKQMFEDTKNNWVQYKHYYLTGETDGQDN